MVRLTYEQVDANTVYIVETGGLFPGHTVEEIREIADNLVPNYQTHNMSNAFPGPYFNFCLRKELLKCRLSSASNPSTTSLHPEQLSPTLQDESGRSESSTDTASSSV